MDNLQHFRRTDYCGTFTAANVGQEISVCGWVQRQRNLGSLIFVDLRDRTGLLQLAFDDSTPRDLFEKAASLRGEYVIAAKGLVREQESRAAHRGHRGEGHRTPSAGQGGHPAF